MFQPKQTKYKKQQKGRNKRIATKGIHVEFGKYGLKSLDCGRISGKQIESARRVISRSIKKGGKIWIRIFPDKPITKKPVEVRQGKGKGNVEYWVSLVQPGKILFELEGVDLGAAKEAFRLSSFKLPVRVIFVERF